MYISLQLCPLERSRSIEKPIVVSTPSSQSLVCNYHFHEKNQGFLEKQLILGLGEGVYKESLGHPAVLEKEPV